MATYEVFLKKEGNHPFAHVGALDAPDDELALMFARECYCRRSEGAEMWVVARDHLLVADPNELEVADRSYRHNDGKFVASLRKAQSADGAPADGAPAE